MTDKEKEYRERVVRFAKDLYKEMLFSVEWETLNMEKEKANAKRCAIKATEYLINATANFDNPRGIQQDIFYIDVLQELESYD